MASKLDELQQAQRSPVMTTFTNATNHLSSIGALSSTVTDQSIDNTVTTNPVPGWSDASNYERYGAGTSSSRYGAGTSSSHYTSDTSRDPLKSSATYSGASSGTAPAHARSTSELKADLQSRIAGLDSKALMDELKLTSLLGVGSMGTVYNATLLGQHFVVKVVEHGSGLLLRDQMRGWLARLEACVSSCMVHPNIVATYMVHTGEVSTAKLTIAGRRGHRQARDQMKVVTLLVQEFCSRGTLRKALEEAWLGTHADGLTYCKVCAQLLAQVAFGLMHMHACSVVHCDLTASNILLQSVPEDQRLSEHLPVRAKIGDLGVAYVIPTAGSTGQVPSHGTVSHAPPEVLEDTAATSTATDIWAFGVLMWEMWTGEVPFAGLAAQSVVVAVKRGVRPTWPDHTPPIWLSLASKCWHADPAERPTASQLASALVKISGILCKVDTATRAVDVAPADSVEVTDERPPTPPPADFAEELDELEALLQATSVEPSGRGSTPGHGEAEAPLPMYPETVPEGDAPAALLWHMMRAPDPEDCLTVELPLGRKMIVSRVPYLNADHLLGRV